jgi:small acid-soluble spore protein (thioredoxin-like protein)
MKSKPDDRTDNVDKIQRNIDNTIENFRKAEESLEETDSETSRKQIIDKNHRREEALDGMRSEIRDEAKDKEKGYK